MVLKNTLEGLKYLNKASSQNHQLAQRYLKKRNGDVKSVSEPIQPVTNDQELLARAKKLYTGIGSGSDYELAFRIFLSLAQEGNPEAARYVGIMKFSGKGTAKSISDARQWLSVAAQKRGFACQTDA